MTAPKEPVDDAVSRTVVDLGWDDRGNLTEQPAVGDLRGKLFGWSIDDRLTQSTDTATGAVRRFAYDSAGERVLEWWDGGTGTEARVFVRDQAGAVVSEWRNVPGTTEFGVSVDYLSLAGLPVAEIHHDGGGDRLLFVSADHLGSPRVVFDDHGNLVDHFVFEPFGEIRESGLQPPATTHLFTGHERDVGEMASGLDYMHQRYFSPVLKRFISVDPVRGKIANSQSWNRYSYVLNNPMRLVDLDGRQESPWAMMLMEHPPGYDPTVFPDRGDMTISFEGSVEGVGGLSGAGLSGGIAFDTRGNIGLIGTVTAKFGPGVMVGLGAGAAIRSGNLPEQNTTSSFLTLTVAHGIGGSGSVGESGISASRGAKGLGVLGEGAALTFDMSTTGAVVLFGPDSNLVENDDLNNENSDSQGSTTQLVDEDRRFSCVPSHGQ